VSGSIPSVSRSAQDSSRGRAEQSRGQSVCRAQHRYHACQWSGGDLNAPPGNRSSPALCGSSTDLSRASHLGAVTKRRCIVPPDRHRDASGSPAKGPPRGMGYSVTDPRPTGRRTSGGEPSLRPGRGHQRALTLPRRPRPEAWCASKTMTSHAAAAGQSLQRQLCLQSQAACSRTDPSDKQSTSSRSRSRPHCIPSAQPPSYGPSC